MSDGAHGVEGALGASDEMADDPARRPGVPWPEESWPEESWAGGSRRDGSWARHLAYLEVQVAEGTYEVDGLRVADSMLRLVGASV